MFLINFDFSFIQNYGDNNDVFTNKNTTFKTKYDGDSCSFFMEAKKKREKAIFGLMIT